MSAPNNYLTFSVRGPDDEDGRTRERRYHYMFFNDRELDGRRAALQAVRTELSFADETSITIAVWRHFVGLPLFVERIGKGLGA